MYEYKIEIAENPYWDDSVEPPKQHKIIQEEINIQQEEGWEFISMSYVPISQQYLKPISNLGYFHLVYRKNVERDRT